MVMNWFGLFCMFCGSLSCSLSLNYRRNKTNEQNSDAKEIVWTIRNGH